MRRNDIVLFLLALVIVWFASVIYLAGTSSDITPQVNAQNIKISDVGLIYLPDAGQPQPFAFEDVIDQIPSYLVETKGVSSNVTTHYIRGTNIDTDGKATKWVFGIRYDNQSALMYYDVSGWQSVPWQGGFPEQEIRNGTFFSPTDLVRKNSGILFGSTPVQKDQVQLLELGNGVYTVTVNRLENRQIFLFDAKTGALIP
ncbi:MAG: hypothetical protein OS112_00880 [Methanoregula sp.]|nr:MAG: hypothetical protein OS112_00880 [Methanoregula sp.]